MRHQLREFADDAALARAAAAFVAQRAVEAVAAHGSFVFAVSGGRTPWAMFAELASCPMPWPETVIFQVDERVAPDGDESRNLTNLVRSLGDVRPTIKPMPVNEADLDRAGDRYAASLPERFDLVHLGLGPDGHTASLVPGDPVLDVSDRLIALTSPYQGQRRMTMTYPALARADQVLWLITGADKREPLAKLVAGDTSIPAGRVEAGRSLILADKAAT